jgi:hypothetical protein
MKTTPLTTSFIFRKGNNIEIDQFVNPKNQGKSWISFGERHPQGKWSSVNPWKRTKMLSLLGRNTAQMKWPTVNEKNDLKS